MYAQARGRELCESQIITVKHRFNDLKPFVWTGAVSPSSYKGALDQAVGELHEIAPDESGVTVVRSEHTPAAGAGSATTALDSETAVTVVSPLLEELLLGVPSVDSARASLGLSVMDSRNSLPVGKDLIAPIHPVGSLNLDLFSKSSSGEGVEKGVEVLPEDSPALYDELVAFVAARPALQKSLGAELARLEPDTYFPNGMRIFKIACHNYGKELVNLLKAIWAIDVAAAREIVQKLGQRVQDAFMHMEACLHITSPKVYYRCEVCGAPPSVFLHVYGDSWW
jgi:hypothetical protein